MTRPSQPTLRRVFKGWGLIGGSMKITVKAHAKPGGFPLVSIPGLVQFDGLSLLPHEAAMLAQALNHAADKAEDLAATEAAQPVAA